MNPPPTSARGDTLTPGRTHSAIKKTKETLLIIKVQRRVMREKLASGASPCYIAAAAGVTRSAARQFLKTGGKTSRQRRPMFLFSSEGDLLVQFVMMRALVGRGLIRGAFMASCEECIQELSPFRRLKKRGFFGGSTRPGKKVFHLLRCSPVLATGLGCWSGMCRELTPIRRRIVVRLS